jgi:hypothetical protein
MSDGRWIDVDADIANAIRHFGNAVEIYGRGGLDDPGLEGYERSAAFQFAVQSGYTAAEAAMERIMGILNEEVPTGENYHRDLVLRLSLVRADEYARPALFSPEVTKDLVETMRARHRARHSYDDFEAAKAEPTVEATKRLLVSLPAAVAEFRKAVDPAKDHDGGGDGAGGGAGGGPSQAR